MKFSSAQCSAVQFCALHCPALHCTALQFKNIYTQQAKLSFLDVQNTELLNVTGTRTCVLLVFLFLNIFLSFWGALLVFFAQFLAQHYWNWNFYRTKTTTFRMSAKTMLYSILIWFDVQSDTQEQLLVYAYWDTNKHTNKTNNWLFTFFNVFVLVQLSCQKIKINTAENSTFLQSQWKVKKINGKLCLIF